MIARCNRSITGSISIIGNHIHYMYCLSDCQPAWMQLCSRRTLTMQGIKRVYDVMYGQNKPKWELHKKAKKELKERHRDEWHKLSLAQPSTTPGKHVLAFLATILESGHEHLVLISAQDEWTQYFEDLVAGKEESKAGECTSLEGLVPKALVESPSVLQALDMELKSVVLGAAQVRIKINRRGQLDGYKGRDVQWDDCNFEDLLEDLGIDRIVPDSGKTLPAFISSTLEMDLMGKDETDWPDLNELEVERDNDSYDHHYPGRICGHSYVSALCLHIGEKPGHESDAEEENDVVQ